MNNNHPFSVADTDKLGLALSGGGFRAALFHLGVLARMAELDLLRHVQVLSTVSGGSIIGAMYYLKVKQLLESPPNPWASPTDYKAAYITLVSDLEQEFLKGVQKNLRTRALLNPFKNAKMMVSDDYSRSDRMAELYNETFYRPIHNPGSRSCWECFKDVLGFSDDRGIRLKDLKIGPPGTSDGFNVDVYNQSAACKIPKLTINATTLNSGEHWTFTAASVGVFSEPVLLVEGNIYDTPSLIAKLQADHDPVTLPISQFIWAAIPNDTQKLLTTPGTNLAQQESAFFNALNTIIQGDSIYDPARFARVALRPKTQALLAQNPTGEQLLSLNRLLLEDAYPADIQKRRDRKSKTRYPRLKFDGSALTPAQKDKLNSLNLADAVSASACVPALFSPFAIHGLYRQNGTDDVVELVDGGVFDNQGLAALFDEDCTHIICSDACGQLRHDRTPASGAFSVFMRSNEVLMERVRGLLVEDIDDYERRMLAESGTAVDARFFHLRDAFSGTSDFPSFSQPTDSSGYYDNNQSTDGQIFLLSAIRTDLDTFADTEAKALMYDGYCLADKFLNQSAGLAAAPANDWKFLDIKALMAANQTRLSQCLAVGGDMFFKAFRLMGTKGKAWGGALVVAALLGVWWVVYQLLDAYAGHIQALLESPKIGASVLVIGTAAWIFLQRLPKEIQYLLKAVADAIRVVRIGNRWVVFFPVVALGALGSVVAFIQIYVVSRIYKQF
ncbi:MAG: patatin-like phospholipase family protein [Gammaproteobacteria bacterium]